MAIAGGLQALGEVDAVADDGEVGALGVAEVAQVNAGGVDADAQREDGVVGLVRFGNILEIYPLDRHGAAGRLFGVRERALASRSTRS